MDNLCKSCANYNKNYDEFRQEYYDVEKIGENREKHGCVMYDDHIPYKIWDDHGDCPYYFNKEKIKDGKGN